MGEESIVEELAHPIDNLTIPASTFIEEVEPYLLDEIPPEIERNPVGIKSEFPVNDSIPLDAPIKVEECDPSKDDSHDLSDILKSDLPVVQSTVDSGNDDLPRNSSLKSTRWRLVSAPNDDNYGKLIKYRHEDGDKWRKSVNFPRLVDGKTNEWKNQRAGKKIEDQSTTIKDQLKSTISEGSTKNNVNALSDAVNNDFPVVQSTVDAGNNNLMRLKRDKIPACKRKKRNAATKIDNYSKWINNKEEEGEADWSTVKEVIANCIPERSGLVDPELDKKKNEDEEPVEKKIRDHTKGDDSGDPRKVMECPDCMNYRSTSLGSIVTHYRKEHGLTPAQGEIAFRCDCGHVGQSQRHANTDSGCLLRSFTIFYMKTVEYPKCLWCESRLSNARGYAEHLRRRHDRTLTVIGYYLLCSCGFKITCENSAQNHLKKCNARQFTIHQL